MTARPKIVMVVLVMAGALAGACEPTMHPDADHTAAPRHVDGSTRTVEIYAAVVTQLVTEDNTFGGGEAPFEHVYIVDAAVTGAGLVRARDRRAERFEAAVRTGLRRELNELPPVDFVSDPDVVRGDRQGNVRADAVLITLGPIIGNGERVEVGASLWCSRMCGRWLTYVVEFGADGWIVTGTTGPQAIS